MNLDDPVSEHFVAASRDKLPRRKLGRGTLALLILLRVYVLLAIPIVIYAFIRALNQ
jgi:hypothetical protein